MSASIKNLAAASFLIVASAGLIPAQSANPVSIAVLGDSLAAGYGLPEAQGFPSRLQAALKAKGREVKVIDAGVSGDTW